jgi:hypothetical protein
VSAAYQALLREGDQYLEEAQAAAASPAAAMASAALASAFYARAALEKPDASGQLFALIAAAKAASERHPEPAPGDEVVQSMDRHPAGKKRVTRKAAPRSATPRSVK